MKKWECILRIEASSGTYEKYDFFPYRLHGRVLLSRAEKAIKNGAEETARRYLDRAIKDFEDSTRLGLPSNGKELEKAKGIREGLEKSAPAVKDPEPKFKAEWDRLLGEHRFLDAKKWIESDGSFLAAQQRSDYLAKTGQRCHAWLAARCQDFLQGLESAKSPMGITGPGSVEFSRTFALPARDQLVSTLPSYEWCIAVHETLLVMRDDKNVTRKLLDHAIRALPLVPKGENGWYRWAEGIAYSIVRDTLEKNSEEAKTGPAKRREELRKESSALRDQWSRFEKKAKESASYRPRDLESLISFPSEYPGVEKLPLDLEDALAETGFRKALEEFERRLQDPGDNLTLESRREILRCRIAAGALLRLYDKKTEVQAADEMKAQGAELKNLEGSFEMTRFGPRVEEVFTLLGRNP